MQIVGKRIIMYDIGRYKMDTSLQNVNYFLDQYQRAENLTGHYKEYI